MPTRRRCRPGPKYRPYVVHVLEATEEAGINVIHDWPSLCLDQRAFGPRRLLVAFADRTGLMLYLTYADRLDDLGLALRCAVDTVVRNDGSRSGLAAVVAFNDEPVSTEIPADVGERFTAASLVCAEHDLRLVDWLMCDDDMFRSMRFSIDPDTDWWPWPTDEAA